MKVTELQIRRAASYESNAGMLTGSIELSGEGGKQTINLSPGAISRLIKVISAEVQTQATANTTAIKSGLQDAIDGGYLLENDGSVTATSIDEPF